ncbi:anosmin-1 isoform X1 [Culex quinquefasciatus]|uniref:anosmin-1 isoform X1 n=1 Tax=Culex quinquefasciatus TaxID=7176 RepID=UPI0018E3A219|nr:anosmin-1 isoform X1 [Culex quinquefasciatus]
MVKMWIHGAVRVMLVQQLVAVCGVSSLLSSALAASSLAANRPRHTDNLLIARCRSKCTNTFDKMMCESTCIRDYLENSAYKKYGDCPKDPLNRLESICLNTCHGTDYHCPGVEKCCPHSCGLSCQHPMGLEKIRGLPPVPSHVKLFEAGRGYRIAEIHWEINLEEEQLTSAIYFVVESRHHIGMSFAERKLENDWQNHTPTAIFELKRAGSQKRYVGEMKLKPGRWYQVRVAAVNELGTRGYSVVSREFQLSKKPNPPQSPKNLTLGPLVPNANGTYNRKVTWQLPRSDLPVDKYKISWSLYLNASTAGNSSLFKETATVSAPARHYEIRGLHPNSIYYLQIHAISVYGKRRLKSAAASDLMNTSIAEGVEKSALPSMDNMLMSDASSSHHRRTKSGPSSLGLNYKFIARKTGLAVRITWPERAAPAGGRYRLHLCRGGRECFSKPMQASSHDVTVKQKTSFEFLRLDFDTRYTVGLRFNRKRPARASHGGHHQANGGYDSVRTFVTPKCDVFARDHPDLQLECSA